MKRANSGFNLFSLILLVQLTACGASHFNSNDVKGTDADIDDIGNPVPPAQVEAQKRAAENGILHCDSADQCNPSVALLSVATGTDKGLERCSAFLISADRLLTNDHCLKGSIALKTQDPSSIIFAHFAQVPGTNTTEQTVAIKSIEVRSHQNGLASKDYAILQLDHPLTDRDPLRLSRRGFQPNEAANIFRVEMMIGMNGTLDGKISRLDCMASYHTMLYPVVDSPDYPLMTFGDCAIEFGNSGSPIFNSSGEVGAINQGFLALKQDANLNLNARVKSYLLDSSFGEVAVGTQLECIPELSPASAARCGVVQDAMGMMPEDYVAALNFNNAMLPSSPTGQGWQLMSGNSQSSRSFLAIPSCVRAGDVQDGTVGIAAIAFSRGLSSKLQVEWRDQYAEGIRNLDFTVIGMRGRQVQLRNADYGSISVRECN